MSLFVLHFGTDIEYKDVAHHTILFGPRYKGLLDEIFKGYKLPMTLVCTCMFLRN